MATQPPECPAEVAAEEATVRLFLAYLKQQATKNALMAIAYDQQKLREFANYVHTLSMCDARSNDGLRHVVSVAPVLAAVVDMASNLPEAIMPQQALPSAKCVNVALSAYHQWVQAQA